MFSDIDADADADMSGGAADADADADADAGAALSRAVPAASDIVGAPPAALSASRAIIIASPQPRTAKRKQTHIHTRLAHTQC